MNIQKIKITRQNSEFFGVIFDATKVVNGWSAFHQGHPTMTRFKDSFYNTMQHPFMFFAEWESEMVS